MTYTSSLLVDRPLYGSTAPRLATATAWTSLQTGDLQYWPTRSITAITPSEQLQIHSSPSGDCTVVHLVGELDILTQDLTCVNLRVLLAQQGPRLVLDCAKLTFADACGLGTLQSASENATKKGGWVRLACVSELTRRVLEIVDTANWLPVYDTVAAAIAGSATCAAPRQG